VAARVELPREENRGLLQDLVCLPQLPVLPLQLRDPGLIGTADAEAFVRVDLGLENPPAQGLPADVQLRSVGRTGGKNGVVLTEVVQDHPRGTLTLILGVSLGHNRYPPQKGSGLKPGTVQFNT